MDSINIVPYEHTIMKLDNEVLEPEENRNVLIIKKLTIPADSQIILRKEAKVSLLGGH